MFIIKYWKNFYRYSGKKLLLILFISPLIGVLDGVGISLIIPILEDRVASNPDSENSFLIKIKEAVEHTGIEPTFSNLLLIIVFILICKNVLRFVFIYLSSNISAEFIKKIRFEILYYTKGMDYTYYINAKIGHILNTITSDSFRYSASQQAFIQAISGFFVLGGYLLLLFINSWKISFMVIILGGGISYLYRWLNQLAKKYSRLTANYNKYFSSIIIEAITYFKYLKATRRFSFFGSKLYKNINGNADVLFKATIINGIPTVIQEPITIVIIFLIFIFNNLFFQEPFSVVLIVLAISYRLNGVLSQFQSNMQRFYTSLGSMEAVNELIESLKSNQEAKLKNNAQINSFKDEIRLESINFSYGQNNVLNNLSLSIPKNKTIAIVGSSGAGKSTLVDILCGLLKPKSGKILIDENQFEHLANADWQKRIGYITQENIVFDGSVLENISFQEDANPLSENFRNALLWANADEFVEKLPEKYNTALGERGIRLSGGQRQRISIARELNKLPDVLIMDEATSALDSESEQIIQSSVDKLKGKFTVIIIAHRLATIKNADIIYLLDEGEIIETGDFESLVNDKNSRFYIMAALQQMT